MDGVYVVRMKHEEVKNLILEELKKSSMGDIGVYIRTLESLDKLRDEDGVIVRIDSLPLFANKNIRRKLRENITNKVMLLKQRLEEMKQRAITDNDVDLSEIEAYNELLEAYQQIAENNDYYVMIV